MTTLLWIIVIQNGIGLAFHVIQVWYRIVDRATELEYRDLVMDRERADRRERERVTRKGEP